MIMIILAILYSLEKKQKVILALKFQHFPTSLYSYKFSSQGDTCRYIHVAHKSALLIRCLAIKL